MRHTSVLFGRGLKHCCLLFDDYLRLLSHLHARSGPAIALSFLELLFAFCFLCLGDALNDEEGLIGSETRENVVKHLGVLIEEHVSEGAVVDNLHDAVHELELILLKLVARQPLCGQVLLNHDDGLGLQLLVVFDDVLAMKDALRVHL